MNGCNLDSVDSIAGEVVSRNLRPFFVFNVKGVFIGFELQSVLAIAKKLLEIQKNQSPFLKADRIGFMLLILWLMLMLI